MNGTRLGLLCLLLISPLLANCSGTGYGGGGGGGVSPQPIIITIPDPIGDNFGTIGTNFDITQVQTTRPSSGATALSVTVTFVQPVSLPAPGTTPTNTQNAILLAFNVGAAGSTISGDCGPLGTTYANVSFIVDPGTLGGGRQADGGYNILTWPALTPTGAEAQVSNFGGNAVTFSVPLSAIGSLTGATQMGVVAGNGAQPTDCAPNGGEMST